MKKISKYSKALGRDFEYVKVEDMDQFYLSRKMKEYAKNPAPAKSFAPDPADLYAQAAQQATQYQGAQNVYGSAEHLKSMCGAMLCRLGKL